VSGRFQVTASWTLSGYNNSNAVGTEEVDLEEDDR
jgi:hypothetical protein